jgi:hypothetical protein
VCLQLGNGLAVGEPSPVGRLIQARLPGGPPFLISVGHESCNVIPPDAAWYLAVGYRETIPEAKT